MLARLRYALITLLLLSQSASADPRQTWNPQSPNWLTRVGSLTVPSSRWVAGDQHFFSEHCSATLIAPNLLLSGWHCIEYYQDLSRDIIFRLPGVDQAPMTAMRIADGGGMDADWLLLKIIGRTPAARWTPLDLGTPSLATGMPVTLAGYSRDAGLGQRGQRLTYHEGCTVTANEHYRVATNCLAYKGASGGPVFHQGQLIGVVSSGDSRSVSYYTPTASFINAIKARGR